MKYIYLSRILFFAAMLLIWHYVYPHTLLRMEEEAFFINTPDYYTFYFRLPEECLLIAGNYLAQFYIHPWAGAFLQALMPLLVLLCTDAVLYALFRKKQMLWLSFVPATLLALLCPGSPAGGEALLWVALTGLLALVLWSLSLLLNKRPLLSLTRLRIEVPKLQWLCPLIAVAVMGASLSTNSSLLKTEKRICMEHWGQQRQWNKILEAIPQQTSDLDELQLRYTLLALSEKDLLGERFFHFPISNSWVFNYPSEVETHEHYRFNSIFFWMLNTPNEALRFAYQHGQRGDAGMTFEALRKLAEWNAQKGDERQAEFYLNLLNHSSCHATFIKLCRLFLQQAPQERSQKTFFISTRSIVLEAAIMLELDPDNPKPIDYMLCGALADREIEAFYEMFNTYWPKGKPIPAHYQEALLTLSSKYPEIPSTYPISDSKKAEYADFMALVNGGQNGVAIANTKYNNTFWRYMLNTGK